MELMSLDRISTAAAQCIIVLSPGVLTFSAATSSLPQPRLAFSKPRSSAHG